jgi:hypothetical protein
MVRQEQVISVPEAEQFTRGGGCAEIATAAGAAGLASAGESRRGQRAGLNHEEIGGEKAERRYAEREMSRTNVLTPG